MNDQLEASREKLIEALGRQSAFWGVGKVTGELFAILYLAQEPLSLGEVAEALKVTKGNVSVAIRVLEQLGMVKRSFKRGDRRVFFEAETDFWLIAHHVLERRNKPEFNESFSTLQTGINAAQNAGSGPEKDFVLDRLEKLNGFYRELDAIVSLLLKLEPKQMSKLIHLLSRLPK